MQICSRQIEKSVGTNSKVLYIICRNFIQRGVNASAVEKKSKNLTTRFKTNTLDNIFLATTFVNNVNAKMKNIQRNQHGVWPCITRDTIHRHTWCTEGFAMHYRAMLFQTCTIYGVKESLTATQKGCIDFSYFECLKANIFQYNFLEGHNVREKGHYASSIQRSLVTILVTEPEL